MKVYVLFCLRYYQGARFAKPIVTPLIDAVAAGCAFAESPFRYREVVIPMRDGVHLQTALLTPARQKGPLPILLGRTPYGVPEKAPEAVPTHWRELAAPVDQWMNDDMHRFGAAELRLRIRGA
jgi:predicted acyl esterase